MSDIKNVIVISILYFIFKYGAVATVHPSGNLSLALWVSLASLVVFIFPIIGTILGVPAGVSTVAMFLGILISQSLVSQNALPASAVDIFAVVFTALAYFVLNAIFHYDKY